MSEKVAIPMENLKPMAQKVLSSQGNIPLSSDIDSALENVKHDKTFNEIKSNLRSDAGKKLAQDLDSLIATGQDVANADQDNNLAKMLLHARKAKMLGENEPNSEEVDNMGESLDFAYASAINLIKLMATSPEFRGTLNGLMSLFLDTVKVNALPESQQNLTNISDKGETTTLGQYKNQAARAAEERGYTAENMKHKAADVTGMEGLRNMDVGQGQSQNSSYAQTPGQGLVDQTQFTSFGQSQGFGNQNQHSLGQTGYQSQPTADFQHHLGQTASTGYSGIDSHRRTGSTTQNPHMGQSAIQQFNSGVGQETTNLEAGDPALDRRHPAKQAAHVASELGHITSSKLSHIEIPNEISDKALNLFIDKMIYLRSKPEFRKAFGDVVDGLTDVVENLLAKGNNLKDSKEKEEITFIAKVTPTDHEAVIPVFVPPQQNANHRSPSEKEWALAYFHGRQLLENQKSGKELSVLIREAKSFLRLIANDERLRSWFDAASTWLRRGMNEDGYLKSDEFTREYRRLRQDFQDSIVGRHQPAVDSLNNAGRDYIKAVGNDPNVVAVQDISSSFFSDMFLDDAGNLTLKRDLLEDFARMIPILNKRFARMELPGILHEDDDIYAMIDNVILESTGLIPEVFEITTRTRVDINHSRFNGVFALHLSHIQLSARNMDFSFKKKSGFPKVSEIGKADFRVYDRGISADIEYTPWYESKERSGLKLTRCDVTIDALDVRVHEPKKHSQFLHSMVRPILRKTLKKQIADMMETSLKGILDPKANVPAPKGKTSIILPKSAVKPLHSKAEVNQLMQGGGGNISNPLDVGIKARVLTEEEEKKIGAFEQ